VSAFVKFIPVEGGSLEMRLKEPEPDESVAELQAAYHNLRKQAGIAEQEGRTGIAYLMHLQASNIARLLRVGRAPDA
jgi:hypothetical protein